MATADAAAGAAAWWQSPC